MAALVSILIPAFNAERWIGAAIKSATDQTWANKEIIVIDDGSSDRTLSIARRFESKSVQVISQENRGASAARNEALSLAQGDYIQYLDADDVLALDKIAEQMKHAQPGHSSLELLSAAFGVFHIRTERAIFKPTAIWHDLTPIEWISRNFSEHAWMFPGAWLISRRICEKTGPWDERLSLNDDGEYICRAVLASERVTFIKSSICFYRNSGYTQLSRDTSERGLQSLLLSLRLCIEHLRSYENSDRTRLMCLALLQMYLPYFYPERKEQLKEIELLAKDLGGRLESPNRNWKVRILDGVLGGRLTRKTMISLHKMSLAVAVKWDEICDKGNSTSITDTISAGR